MPEACANGSASRLHRVGVRVYSHQEPFLDPESPFHDTILALIATIAKMERERLIEGTRAGQQRARDEGKHIGRPQGKDKKKRRTWRSGKGA
jgi:putative DNA-invertase from lambdoid prophage Rac